MQTGVLDHLRLIDRQPGILADFDFPILPEPLSAQENVTVAVVFHPFALGEGTTLLVMTGGVASAVDPRISNVNEAPPADEQDAHIVLALAECYCLINECSGPIVSTGAPLALRSIPLTF